eukprot:TRINITY_DN3898_c0_g1_i4.p1 TRINITY_DN3898_c0_g1~~TRINITY_DN3898_c0_g1_i4.p1  ORF type:complete len:436 (-),score=63.25 TRINITY_DN3898_c0_g1_i4:659-1966(-)
MSQEQTAVLLGTTLSHVAETFANFEWDDKSKFFACLFGTFFVSPFFWLLRSPTLRLIYSGGLGLALGFFIFGLKFWHPVVCSSVAYLLLRVLSPSVAPKAVFVFTFIYLTGVQYYVFHYFYLQWTLDVEYPIMLITIKTTSLAWSIWDHHRQQKKEQLSDRRAQYAVSIPSLLEFYGFIFHFGALLVGPPFEFKDYIDFINRANLKGQNEFTVMRTCFVKGFRKLFKGICFSVGFYLITVYPTSYAKEDEFVSKALWYKFLYVQLAVSLTRWKYYCIWSIAEGACISGGFGFRTFDKTGSAVWGPVDTCHVVKVETAQSIKDAVESWNIPTQVWMKEYVYLRFMDVFPKASRLIATLVTMLVGAMWHGLYPGYYLSFLSVGFYTAGARELRRVLRPYVLDDKQQPIYPRKYVYDVLGFMLSLGVMNYALSAFMVS